LPVASFASALLPSIDPLMPPYGGVDSCPGENAVPKASPLHQIKDVPWQQRPSVSVEHAAELIGISRKHAYNMIRANEIRAVKFRKRLVVPVAEIFRLLNANQPPTKQRSKPRRADQQQPEA
jgi:excisionase family DNA binding protein